EALIVFTGAYPSAFLAASLPRSATYTFALTADWTAPAEVELTGIVRQRIAASSGPLISIMPDVGDQGSQSVVNLLSRLEREYGLSGAAEDCVPFRTSMDREDARWLACPLEKRGG
ncbi:MAG: hypothetical protein ACK4MQ_04250, partial [Hyphomonas sp.]